MFNLVEHFDGHGWQIVRVPARLGRWDAAAVSCRALNECWILGTSAGRPQPVALRLLHGSWRRVPIPDGPQEASNFIDGVDCASSSDCWAVGQSIRGIGAANSAPLAEEWNGSAWRIAKVTGNPGRNSFFNGISCASISQCVAVGGTANGARSSPTVAVSRPLS